MLTLFDLKLDIRCTVLSVYGGFHYTYLVCCTRCLSCNLFDYCAVIWCPNKNQLRIMECLHSKVALSVSHIRKKSSTCFCYTLLER